MSLLPAQVLPETEPIGTVSGSSVRITHNWYLLLYNLAAQVLGTAGNFQGLPSSAIQELASADTDAVDADAIALRASVSNAIVQAIQPQDVVASSADLPDIARALLLAQDAILPDPPSAPQPVAPITVGASPFTYTAPFAGTVVVTGGSVSTIAMIRHGTSVATGLTSALIPVSRGDQVQVAYVSAPTMTFVPSSPY